jgi:hypothetical protein
MKKYILLAFIIITHTVMGQSSVQEVLKNFPYQNKQNIDASLSAIDNWSTADWKELFKLLDDTATQKAPTYAIHAYVNAHALDPQGKERAKKILNKYKSILHNETAKIFITQELKLLIDASIIQKRNESLPATDVYTKPIINSKTGAQSLLEYQDGLEKATNPIEKRRWLQKVSTVPGISSFIIASKYLEDSATQNDAALIITRLALNDKTISGHAVRASLEKALPLIKGVDSAILVPQLTKRLKYMPYDNGYEYLFNGKDLTGWQGLVGNPIYRAQQTPEKLNELQAKADAKAKEDWIVKDGLLVFTGHGDNLCTVKKYGDFEMFVDWKITEKGDAGIYLRGSPQVQIWDTSRREVGAEVGSGGLYNNTTNVSKPLVVADNKIGEWNNFRIIMKGDKVTVYLNGVLVVDNITLENYWDRKQPIFPMEQLELQAHGTYVAYRNIFVRDLTANNTTPLSADEQKDGFTSIFDGSNLDQWVGNKEGYLLENGSIVVNPEKGSGGNLYTKEEYKDFIYRFEFQLTPGANNGIGVHAPLDGDAAYVGMEVQVLDSEHPMYKDLQPYQYHGSVYGVIPAKRGYLLPTGSWNQEEIYLKGNHIRVTLNGTIIVEGDIKEASKNGTMDHKEHPGLLRTQGHMGFLGHGDVVRFKNIRIKKL